MTRRETEKLERITEEVHEDQLEEPVEEVVRSYVLRLRCWVCDMPWSSQEVVDPEHAREEARADGWSDEDGDWRCEAHKLGATGVRKYDVGR